MTQQHSVANSITPISTIAKTLRGVVAMFNKFRARRDAVRHLQNLDDHLLRDIGIDRSEIHDAVKRATTP